MVTLELPELVIVTGRRLLLPSMTLPKFRLAGLALNRSVAALTVRVALLLARVPRELLMTTENCAPLSAVVVAGVV